MTISDESELTANKLYNLDNMARSLSLPAFRLLRLVQLQTERFKTEKR